MQHDFSGLHVRTLASAVTRKRPKFHPAVIVPPSLASDWEALQEQRWRLPLNVGAASGGVGQHCEHSAGLGHTRHYVAGGRQVAFGSGGVGLQTPPHSGSGLASSASSMQGSLRRCTSAPGGLQLTTSSSSGGWLDHGGFFGNPDDHATPMHLLAGKLSRSSSGGKSGVHSSPHPHSNASSPRMAFASPVGRPATSATTGSGSLASWSGTTMSSHASSNVTEGSEGPARGRIALLSQSCAEWLVPRKSLETKRLLDEKMMHPIFVSPTFELLGEPCVLKLWPSGRSSYLTGDGVKKGKNSWITLGFFPMRRESRMSVKLFIGSRSDPLLISGSRSVYATKFIHPDQLLEAEGHRPFAWDDLAPENVLKVGVEVLLNHRDHCHAHTKNTDRARLRRRYRTASCSVLTPIADGASALGPVSSFG